VCDAQGEPLVRGVTLAPASQRLRLRTLLPIYETTTNPLPKEEGGEGKEGEGEEGEDEVVVAAPSVIMGKKQRLKATGGGLNCKAAMLMLQGGGGGEGETEGRRQALVDCIVRAPHISYATTPSFTVVL